MNNINKNNINKLVELIKTNPDLPIIPMVDAEIVGDDYGYWMGNWGRCEVTEYYLGREKVHFKDDDEEDVLSDMLDCRYGYNREGKDIYTLSDSEWEDIYNSLPWQKAIIVYITT